MYKPLAKLLMDDAKGSTERMIDDLCEAFNVAISFPLAGRRASGGRFLLLSIRAPA